MCAKRRSFPCIADAMERRLGRLRHRERLADRLGRFRVRSSRARQGKPEYKCLGALFTSDQPLLCLSNASNTRLCGWACRTVADSCCHPDDAWMMDPWTWSITLAMIHTGRLEDRVGSLHTQNRLSPCRKCVTSTSITGCERALQQRLNIRPALQGALGGLVATHFIRLK